VGDRPHINRAITRKIKSPLSPPQALRYLDQLAEWPVTTLDYGAIRAAIDLSSNSSISFWDALIVVAASRAGAVRLYSEDLQHDRTLLGVQIVNPFRSRIRRPSSR
jgi:predicted nucleic acid-binding protein